MNCVDYAVNEVINGGDISDYVLELAFTDPNQNITNNWYVTPNQYSVEQGIREKVIHGIVLPRCQVQGGTTEMLDLTGSTIISLGQNKTQVQVPEFVTGGRKIISVIEVYPGSINSSAALIGTGDNFSQCGVGAPNHVLGSLVQGLRSNNQMPQTYTNIKVTGNNTFIIHDIPPGILTLTGKVILESDSNLSHINPAAYPYFAILVALATKSYIYKHVRNKINQGTVLGGVDVDSIKDEVYNYADAWKEYQDYYQEEWLQYMRYSDTQKKADFINQATQRRT